MLQIRRRPSERAPWPGRDAHPVGEAAQQDRVIALRAQSALER